MKVTDKQAAIKETEKKYLGELDAVEAEMKVTDKEIAEIQRQQSATMKEVESAVSNVAANLQTTEKLLQATSPEEQQKALDEKSAAIKAEIAQRFKDENSAIHGEVESLQAEADQ